MYNIGIIGFGGMGHNHFLAMADYPRAKVKGVFDPDLKRRELAKSLGIAAYPSINALFADPEIDIVIIASTNDAHKEQSIKALAAGKHVICEKPATITSTELLEIIEASKKHGVMFTINQNRRMDRDFLLMRENIALIGDVYAIESRVHSSKGLPLGWRTSKVHGGGMLLDWGVHLIDQILYMVDEKVINIFCKFYNIHHSDVDDNFKLILTLESGLTAHIEVGTSNFAALPRWYVLGKQGTLQIDDWNGRGKVASRTDTLEIAATIPHSRHLDAVYDQLLDAIEGKAPLKITADQALRVMKVIESAFLSSETGAAVVVSI